MKKVTLYYIFYFFITISWIFCISIEAQENNTLTLNEALRIANQTSLDAFKSKRKYLIDYWQFRAYNANLLPKMDIDLRPFTYSRSFIQRYDNDLNRDVFRLQENLNNVGEISLRQKIIYTGAEVFVSSGFDRLVTFVDDQTFENYNTTPVRVGIFQPIMAYNDLKWQKRTASLEFEKAKKEYIAQEQEINLKTINLFFDWALAKTKLNLAEENNKNSVRLHEIAKKRYALGSIEKDDLLNLELERFTALTDFAKAEQELKAITVDFQIYLNSNSLENYIPELPEVIPTFQVDFETVIRLAKENNPELLDITIQRINAERDLDKAIKENRFDLSVNASYGLNQQANELADAYANFLDQQRVSINFSMPLLDWGERKGNIQKARMAKELSDIETEQLINDIERNIMLAVNNFNLQSTQVQAALQAKNIADESYQITQKRFASGNVDLLRLLNARSSWQRSQEEYIQSLQAYWSYYYELQSITLYNFIEDTTLSEDFEKLLTE